MELNLGIEDQREELENFMKMLLDNPYSKNSQQLAAFLQEDHKEFQKVLKQKNLATLYPNLQSLEKKSFNYQDEKFFSELIKSLPCFKPIV